MSGVTAMAPGSVWTQLRAFRPSVSSSTAAARADSSGTISTEQTSRVSPTVPIVAPPLVEVAPGSERDDTFFRINGLLLRNPSVVNLLDGCAISLPCHAPDELPVGLMVWQGAMRDDVVLNIAQQIEWLLRPQQP